MIKIKKIIVTAMQTITKETKSIVYIIIVKMIKRTAFLETIKH